MLTNLTHLELFISGDSPECLKHFCQYLQFISHTHLLIQDLQARPLSHFCFSVISLWGWLICPSAFFFMSLGWEGQEEQGWKSRSNHRGVTPFFYNGGAVLLVEVSLFIYEAAHSLHFFVNLSVRLASFQFLILWICTIFHNPPCQAFSSNSNSVLGLSLTSQILQSTD